MCYEVLKFNQLVKVHTFDSENYKIELHYSTRAYMYVLK